MEAYSDGKGLTKKCEGQGGYGGKEWCYPAKYINVFHVRYVRGLCWAPFLPVSSHKGVVCCCYKHSEALAGAEGFTLAGQVKICVDTVSLAAAADARGPLRKSVCELAGWVLGIRKGLQQGGAISGCSQAGIPCLSPGWLGEQARHDNARR